MQEVPKVRTTVVETFTKLLTEANKQHKSNKTKTNKLEYEYSLR